MDTQKKIILPGGAGLVGQNLVARLKDRGYRNIIVLDKHPTNVDILRRIQPDITVEQVDLSLSGDWTQHFEGADTVVMLQAQIGGNDYQEFVRNNITARRFWTPSRPTAFRSWFTSAHLSWSPWPMTSTPTPRRTRRNWFWKAAFPAPSCVPR